MQDRPTILKHYRFFSKQGHWHCNLYTISITTTDLKKKTDFLYSVLILKYLSMHLYSYSWLCTRTRTRVLQPCIRPNPGSWYTRQRCTVALWECYFWVRKFTLSEFRSGSSWHSLKRKDFGSRHNVVRVVWNILPPTFSFSHSSLRSLPPFCDTSATEWSIRTSPEAMFGIDYAYNTILVLFDLLLQRRIHVICVIKQPGSKA